MARARYFASRFFGSRFFGVEASSGSAGGYFGASYFASRYLSARYFRQETEAGSITASLDQTEAADSLESSAVVSQVVLTIGSTRPLRNRRLKTITVRLEATERRDTCESLVEFGPSPIEMDNNLLLLAA